MDELPLVGDKFNIYFPFIVVVFCILVATNALDYACGFFVKSSSYHFVADEDDEDEEEGKIGDQVVFAILLVSVLLTVPSLDLCCCCSSPLSLERERKREREKKKKKRKRRRRRRFDAI